MKIAIMQPYFAPYLGYFQLIHAVDKFVFLDDVSFIKGGWINRNVISLNDRLHRFSIPLRRSSSNKKINETEVAWNTRAMQKLGKTFQQRYARGTSSRRIIDSIFTQKHGSISAMAIASIQHASEHLGITTEFERSSSYDIPRSGDRTEYLIQVCRHENANTYVNSVGGRKLYCEQEFADKGIELRFLAGKKSTSILDVIDLAPRHKVICELEDFSWS